MKFLRLQYKQGEYCKRKRTLNLFQRSKLLFKAVLWINVLIISFVGGIIYVINHSHFLDTRVRAYIDDQVNIDLSNKICDAFCSENIFLIEESKLVDYIENNYFSLKLKKLKYQFPNQANIYLVPRQKVATIRAPNGVFSVDDEFYVFQRLDKEIDSSQIEYDANLNLGEVINDDILKTGIKLSGTSYIIRIRDNESIIELADNIVVRLPQDLTYVKEVSDSLNKIFKEASLNGTGLKEVDLRYSKPVLIY